MRKASLLFFLFSFSLIFSQVAPSIQWQKSLGGIFDDEGFAVRQTTDGGFIVAGSSSSNNTGDVTGNHGSYDYWIVKLDIAGNIQWQKSLGGSGNDYAYDVRQTADGGYIVAGNSNSNDGDVSGHHGTTSSTDYWIVKLDESGNIQWNKSLGGSYSEQARSIQQTADGGYIIGGDSLSIDGDVTGHHGAVGISDYWIVKLDGNGNLQWEKSLGGTLTDAAYSIQQTIDGGFIVAGSSYSNDGDVSGHHGPNVKGDYWIVKLNEVGSIQWQKSLGGTEDESARSIKQTIDGGYVVAGMSQSNDGDVSGHHGTREYYDYWIVKLDSNGIIQWQKSLGGSRHDGASSIDQTTDGGYVITGTSMSNDGDINDHHGTAGYHDYWVVKLNSVGDKVWQKSLGGYFDDFAYSNQQTTDGGYVIAGTTMSNDGDISGNNGQSDYWIVKLSPENLATNESGFAQISAYPNPAKETLNFSEELFNIVITDNVGRIVMQDSLKCKSINVKSLPKGTYIISGSTNSGKKISKKIIKE